MFFEPVENNFFKCIAYKWEDRVNLFRTEWRMFRFFLKKNESLNIYSRNVLKI